jgi:hypothetical protein
MTDHGSASDHNVTQPARQGEVPDWFASSEESPPVVNAAPEEEVKPPVPPSDTEDTDADYTDEVEEEYEEEVEDTEEPEPPSDEDAVEEQPPTPPIGTRRRRPAPEPSAPSGRGYACADVITAIFLLLTILVISATILLLANPRSALNPFQPPTYPAILVLASAVPTDTPTQTLTPEPNTPTPIPSATPTRTLTPTPTVTNTPVVGGGGGIQPTLAQTARSAPTQPLYTLSPFPFTVKPLKFTANATQDGCQWQSIAGSVVDMSNKPIKGLAIRVTGSNGNIDEVHYSGTETRFGEGGFEVFLGATPREDQYTIQLLGRTGAPISDAINIQTKSSCDQNVVIVSFTQNHPY